MGRSAYSEDDQVPEEGLDTGIREPDLLQTDDYTALPTQGVDDPAYRAAVLQERSPEVQASIQLGHRGVTYWGTDRYVSIDSNGAPDADPRWEKTPDSEIDGVANWTRPMDAYDDEAVRILTEEMRERQDRQVLQDEAMRAAGKMAAADRIINGTDVRDLPSGMYIGRGHSASDAPPYERGEITLRIGESRRQHYEELLAEGFSEHEAREEAYGREGAKRELRIEFDRTALLENGVPFDDPLVQRVMKQVEQDMNERMRLLEEPGGIERALREDAGAMLGLRKMREAPDGAEGDLSDTAKHLDGGGLASILAATGGSISDEDVQRLFADSPAGLEAIARAEAAGNLRPAFSSDQVVEADELGVGLCVTGDGNVGVTITLHAAGQAPVVRNLDPYRVLKLITALTQAATQALDSQSGPDLVVDEPGDPSTIATEQLDTDE